MAILKSALVWFAAAVIAAIGVCVGIDVYKASKKFADQKVTAYLSKGDE